MTHEEILRKIAGPNYTGYVPHTVETSTLTFDELNSNYRILRRWPAKITAFFHRNKIKAVFKHNQWIYYILTVDNTVFIIYY